MKYQYLQYIVFLCTLKSEFKNIALERPWIQNNPFVIFYILIQSNIKGKIKWPNIEGNTFFIFLCKRLCVNFSKLGLEA